MSKPSLFRGLYPAYNYRPSATATGQREVDVPIDPEGSRQPRSNAIDFAWQAYRSQEYWSAKVDAKASIVLAVETALLGVILTFLVQTHAFTSIEGWRGSLGASGLGLLSLSVVLAGWVVMPHMSNPLKYVVCLLVLGMRALQNPAPAKVVAWLEEQFADRHTSQLIYFGHLRKWRRYEASLAQRMLDLTESDTVTMLARELVHVSRINWRKHWLLRASFLTALASAILLGIVLVPAFWRLSTHKS